MPGADFLATLGIAHPIIQAPMGGGPSTPELVAAVSNAGGLGSLGAAYLTPDQITAEIKKIRSLTDRPFNVNLFVGTKTVPSHPDPRPMLDILGDIHRRLKIAPPVLPAPEPDPFSAQLEAILAVRPHVFSFTFGIPDSGTISRIKAMGIYVIGMATTVEEARLLERTGIDAIVTQGEESGGHRGTFAGPFESSMVPAVDLLQAVLQAVSIPVIASGGLMTGRDIARVLERGAAAAQLGTAFLPCPEAGVPDVHKKALLSTRQDTTVITRAFSGRPARGLRNAFVNQMEGREEIILPFPVQNALTRPMRSAAAKQGEGEYLSLWAGKGVTQARQMPAAQLVRTLVDEMNATRS